MYVYLTWTRHKLEKYSVFFWRWSRWRCVLYYFTYFGTVGEVRYRTFITLLVKWNWIQDYWVCVRICVDHIFFMLLFIYCVGFKDNIVAWQQSFVHYRKVSVTFYANRKVRWFNCAKASLILCARGNLCYGLFAIIV